MPEPGAHDGFLAEGPIGPRLPLLLVPTSWDTATLEPTHAQHSPRLIALKAAHLQLPLISWLPHLLHTRCPFTISQEDCLRHPAPLAYKQPDLARKLSQVHWLPSREQTLSVRILAEGQSKGEPWNRAGPPLLPGRLVVPSIRPPPTGLELSNA